MSCRQTRSTKNCTKQKPTSLGCCSKDVHIGTRCSRHNQNTPAVHPEIESTTGQTRIPTCVYMIPHYETRETRSRKTTLKYKTRIKTKARMLPVKQTKQKHPISFAITSLDISQLTSSLKYTSPVGQSKTRRGRSDEHARQITPSLRGVSTRSGCPPMGSKKNNAVFSSRDYVTRLVRNTHKHGNMGESWLNNACRCHYELSSICN